MKALILNSGLGKRMGCLTDHFPKCMTPIQGDETILSRQLKSLIKANIREAVITTGYYEPVLIDYINHLNLPIAISFVNNPLYASTNYIYSIYLAKQDVQDDLILMHGDLVYDDAILLEMLTLPQSMMAVSSTLPLPEKDFKAVVEEDKIIRIGIDCFVHALAAQPLYKLNRKDWEIWLNEIGDFCQRGLTSVYAENAFNEISLYINVKPYDVLNRLCGEIDNPQDLKIISERLERGQL